jgi:hypothetical protein
MREYIGERERVLESNSLDPGLNERATSGLLGRKRMWRGSIPWEGGYKSCPSRSTFRMLTNSGPVQFCHSSTTIAGKLFPHPEWD